MIERSALDAVPLFQGVPEQELEWIAERFDARHLVVGERFYDQDDPADELHVLLRGRVHLVRQDGGKESGSFVVEEGDVGGRLPFSRMRSYGTSATALAETTVAVLSAELFPEFHGHVPTILERLVHQMLDRTQTFTRMGAQREKLISLGTMSAGLAHELNNPASAAKRAAQNLQETLQAFDELSSRILVPAIFKETPLEEDPFHLIYKHTTLDGDRWSSLERSDLEDDLGDWLEEHDVESPWEVAATLVSGGLTKDVIVSVAESLRPEQVVNFLEWVPKDVEMRLLTKELIEATSRISDLVNAMKSYTYMDQGLEMQAVDLHRGIVDTLTILKHKWQRKGIQIVREFGDIATLTAYGSELNQVWTNLIANAIDALDEGGTITIRTTHDTIENVACVDVIDDGPGIPEDIQSRILEPFFTTKEVGLGTGIGLDIVDRIVRTRHHGTLQFESRPGHTRFRVRLPLGYG